MFVVTAVAAELMSVRRNHGALPRADSAAIVRVLHGLDDDDNEKSRAQRCRGPTRADGRLQNRKPGTATLDCHWHGLESTPVSALGWLVCRQTE